MNKFNQIINCPHCDQLIWVIELNCKIFRCGQFKKNYLQIPQHASEEECNQYIKEGIFGCGKPFKINDNLEVEKCGYNT
jgi:hypothetical protein